MKRIDFDMSIYSEAAVKEALNTYAEYADIQTWADGNRICCSMQSSRYPEEGVVAEFANYALDLTCRQGSAT